MSTPTGISKHTRLFSFVFFSLLFGLVNTAMAFALKVDIGEQGQQVKAGYEEFTGEHEAGAETRSFYVEGTTVDVTISIGNNNVAGYRDYSGGLLGKDMVYPDDDEITGPVDGSIILALGNLPAGDYSLTCYHNDGKAGAGGHEWHGTLDATVAGAVSASTNDLGVNQTQNNIDDTELGQSTVTFTATGAGDVVITYAPTGDGIDVRAVLNGFELGQEDVTDTDEDGVPDSQDNCPDAANPGQENNDGDTQGDVCDDDDDNDGTVDLADNCPFDSNKTEPGVCGCGVADTDSDGDGTADCEDDCPNDAAKIAPGACGCGVADDDDDGDSIICDDNCPNDPNPDQSDSDNDGLGDVCDGCPDDPDKADPAICGCGFPDTDGDGDGVKDCNDNCPNEPNSNQQDGDGDGLGDACDNCPAIENADQANSDGDACGAACDDCDADPDKCEVGICGCGVSEADSDGDGVEDCIDGCPDDPAKTAPGACGCGRPDVDTDGDGSPNCVETENWGCQDLTSHKVVGPNLILNVDCNERWSILENGHLEIAGGTVNVHCEDRFILDEGGVLTIDDGEMNVTVTSDDEEFQMSDDHGPSTIYLNGGTITINNEFEPKCERDRDARIYVGCGVFRVTNDFLSQYECDDLIVDTGLGVSYTQEGGYWVLTAES